jgi:hypothetical protein
MLSKFLLSLNNIELVVIVAQGGFFMKKWIIPMILLGWVIFALSLYFFTFHGELSVKSSDWGSFGGYISGVITVPFSVISAYFLESPRVHRRPVCLSQATLPDSFKLS